MLGRHKIQHLCKVADVDRIYVTKFYGMDAAIMAVGIDKENPNSDEKRLFYIDYNRKTLAAMRPYFTAEVFAEVEDKM